MKIAVFGSGMVGQVLSAKLVDLDHSVMLGTRDVEARLASTEPGRVSQQTFAEWHRQHPQVALGNYAQAAAHGELIFHAVNGAAALTALQQAGESNLKGKVLIDITNPLDFSQGMPPTLSVLNSDSLGEQIQRAFPQVKVVKTLNTVNAFLMVAPQQVAGGDHDMFLCGDDAGAKSQVTEILKDWFGWQHVTDLGGISNARGLEMYLPFWLRLMGALGTPLFNIKIQR
jgi:predicted dinucleotide-binding enzyme